MSDQEDLEERPVSLSFRAGEVSDDLRARGDQYNPLARRELARYYALLARELPTVTLTEAEALALVDVVTQWRPDPRSIHLLWAQVQDTANRVSAFREKHREEVIRALSEKLQHIPAGAAAALVDAAERYNRGPTEKPARQRLQATGFQITAAGGHGVGSPAIAADSKEPPGG